MSERARCCNYHLDGGPEVAPCSGGIPQTPTKEPPPWAESGDFDERSQEGGPAHQHYYCRCPNTPYLIADCRCDLTTAALCTACGGDPNWTTLPGEEEGGDGRAAPEVSGSEAADQITHTGEMVRLRTEVEHLRSVVADQGRQAVLRQGELEAEVERLQKSVEYTRWERDQASTRVRELLERQGALEEALDAILGQYDEAGEPVTDYASRCFAIRSAKAARAPRTPEEG